MRLSEVYTSVQGEGPNTGLPIQFVRFGGCNMRCPGWPCDTQFAIDPKFKDEWAVLSPAEVFSRLDLHPKHVCITGGEPLLQRTREMEDFGHTLLNNGYLIDLFTNGTQGFPTWVYNSHTSVMMDWKLQGSGEAETDRPMRWANTKQLQRKDGIKFVVCDYSDLQEAAEISRELRRQDCEAQLWVGSAWHHITDEEIISFIRENNLPWRLNVQVHKYIWDATLRGV